MSNGGGVKAWGNGTEHRFARTPPATRALD